MRWREGVEREVREREREKERVWEWRERAREWSKERNRGWRVRAPSRRGVLCVWGVERGWWDGWKKKRERGGH
jgi:hypothetical protein